MFFNQGLSGGSKNLNLACDSCKILPFYEEFMTTKVYQVFF